MTATPDTTTHLASHGTSDDKGDADSEAYPAPYGQYMLLHMLARGGMGNVFLAKTAGTMGIEKHCVVKTLRKQFTHDPEYVARFMQEARVVVQLSHRNICPVFDVGRVGQSYYLAMELVLGRDLRSIQNALADRKRTLPRAVALHIVCEVLDALDYAHRHVDNTTGKPLRIVHRDVSPQNVMVSGEGEVKLIDFGLAESGKAQEEESEPTATVMGKMSYMAPEHARGEAVDARADQFSAAVLAYEMLSGTRYYAGLSAEQIWQQAGPGQFKPAGISDLPRGLREVVEKALSTSREDRYDSCGDFREALLAYTRKQDLHAGARDLRTLMGDLFVDDLQQTRELLQRFAGANANNNFLSGDTSVDGGDIVSIASGPGRTTFHDPTELVRSSGAFPIAPGPTSKAPIVVLAGTILGAIVVAAIGLFIAFHDDGGASASVPVVAPPVVASATPPPNPAPTSTPPPPPTTTTPTPTTPTTTATATPTTTSNADGPPDPTPASSSSSGSSHHRNRHEEKREATTPKKETALTFMDELAYVKRTCPELPCTQASKQKVEGLANASIEEVAAFKKTLHACYDTCKAVHGGR